MIDMAPKKILAASYLQKVYFGEKMVQKASAVVRSIYSLYGATATN